MIRNVRFRWLIVALLSVLNPACKHGRADAQTLYNKYLQQHLIKIPSVVKQAHATGSISSASI